MHLIKCKGAAFTAGHHQSAGTEHDATRVNVRGLLRNVHRVHEQLFATQGGECSRPRLKAAITLIDRARGALEVNAALVPRENRCERGLVIVLRFRFDDSLCKPSEGLHLQIRAHLCQGDQQLRRGRAARDGDGAFQQHRPGIQAGVKPHGGHARFGVATGDCPLDGCGTPPAWQQRRVSVDAAEWWQLQHPSRQDPPVGNHDDGVRLESRQFRLKGFVVLQLVRLHYRDAQSLRLRLHRRGMNVARATHRFVGLRKDQQDFMTGSQECFQGRHRELWRPAEDHTHGNSIRASTIHRSFAACVFCAGSDRA